MVVSSHSDAPEIERYSWLEYIVGGFLHSEQVVGELLGFFYPECLAYPEGLM